MILNKSLRTTSMSEDRIMILKNLFSVQKLCENLSSSKPVNFSTVRFFTRYSKKTSNQCPWVDSIDYIQNLHPNWTKTQAYFFHQFSEWKALCTVAFRCKCLHFEKEHLALELTTQVAPQVPTPAVWLHWVFLVDITAHKLIT